MLDSWIDDFCRESSISSSLATFSTSTPACRPGGRRAAPPGSTSRASGAMEIFQLSFVRTTASVSPPQCQLSASATFRVKRRSIRAAAGLTVHTAWRGTTCRPRWVRAHAQLLFGPGPLSGAGGPLGQSVPINPKAFFAFFAAEQLREESGAGFKCHRR